MLLALLVGLLTAWHLGVRAGLYAGAVALGLLVFAGVVRGMMWPTYAVIVAWCALLYGFGPQLAAGYTREHSAMRGTRAAFRDRVQRWLLRRLRK